AKFDPAELDMLNRALLHEMSFLEAQPRLAILGITGDKAEPFWLAVRGNRNRFKDAVHWWSIVDGDLPEMPDFSEEDRIFLNEAFALLPNTPWDHQTWKVWTEAVKAATGRKGKNLFMPLRLALTGQPHGPELADLLMLIGRERTLTRQP